MWARFGVRTEGVAAQRAALLVGWEDGRADSSGSGKSGIVWSCYDYGVVMIVAGKATVSSDPGAGRVWYTYVCSMLNMPHAYTQPVARSPVDAGLTLYSTVVRTSSSTSTVKVCSHARPSTRAPSVQAIRCCGRRCEQGCRRWYARYGPVMRGRNCGARCMTRPIHVRPAGWHEARPAAQTPPASPGIATPGPRLAAARYRAKSPTRLLGPLVCMIASKAFRFGRAHFLLGHSAIWI